MRHANPSFRLCRLQLIGLCLVLGSAGTFGQDCNNTSLAATAPPDRFSDNGDGTVTDTASGLLWKRCSEGQTWDGTTCAEAATAHSWREAMDLADAATYAGKEDWRLPSLEELAALVEKACSRPAIDPQVFPGTAAAVYWSSTADTTNVDYAWLVHFHDGHGAKGHKYRAGHVRLVRGVE